MIDDYSKLEWIILKVIQKKCLKKLDYQVYLNFKTKYKNELIQDIEKAIKTRWIWWKLLYPKESEKCR